MLGSNISTTFTQHWYNVVTTLANVVALFGFWSNYNIDITFTQHCLDVHISLLGHLEVCTNERCHNTGNQPLDNVGTIVVTTLPQRSSVSWGPPSLTHVIYVCFRSGGFNIIGSLTSPAKVGQFHWTLLHQFFQVWSYSRSVIWNCYPVEAEESSSCCLFLLINPAYR